MKIHHTFIVVSLLLLAQNSFAQQKLYPYVANNLWGITTGDLKVIVPPSFTIRPVFHDGNAAVVRLDFDRVGLIDSTGRYRIPPEYSLMDVRRAAPNGAKYLRDHFVVGKKGNKQYLFSFDTGEQLGPPFDEYNQLLSSSSDLWTVTDDNKWGIYDTKTRNMKLNLEYDHIEQLGVDDVLLMTKGQKRGLYDFRLSKLILPVTYDSLVFDYSKLLFHVPASQRGPITLEAWKGKKHITYLIAENGEKIVPLKKLSAKGTPKKKRGDKPPARLVHEEYPIEIGVLVDSSGVKLRKSPSIVSRDGKFGIVDDQGKEVIPVIYDEVKLIFDGYYKTKSGKKYGVISKKLEVIKEPVLIDVVSYYPFANEWMVIIDGSRMGIMDSSGKIYIPD